MDGLLVCCIFGRSFQHDVAFVLYTKRKSCAICYQNICSVPQKEPLDITVVWKWDFLFFFSGMPGPKSLTLLGRQPKEDLTITLCNFYSKLVLRIKGIFWISLLWPTKTQISYLATDRNPYPLRLLWIICSPLFSSHSVEPKLVQPKDQLHCKLKLREKYETILYHEYQLWAGRKLSSCEPFYVVGSV